MNVVIIFNGLGNQMSQYCFYREKKKRDDNTKYVVLCPPDKYQLDRLFGIPYQRDSLFYYLYKIVLDKAYFSKHKFLRKFLRFVLGICRIRLIVEPLSRDYDAGNFENVPGLTFYRGGWHSELYFKDDSSQVRQLFSFPAVSDKEFARVADMISRSESVSLHIRRGDYVGLSEFQNICTDDYYRKSIDYIRGKLDAPTFFVFSDDVDYIRKKFGDDPSFVIVDVNSGENSWRDMSLMSMCKHNIIANSTFSWWGAWLNRNPAKIVIHPKYHLFGVDTNDFYPHDWITM
jgi:hypothetical protein